MKKALLFICIITIGTSLFAQQKYALVIGNANYSGITGLTNPVNDANDMETVLRGLGFTVDKVLNGNLMQMETAIQNFKQRLNSSRNTYGFFYYAGHGVGVQSSGENFLIPVDANTILSESHLRQRAVSVQTLLDNLNEAGNELNMIVLDACRDNPFQWTQTRGASRGLFVVNHAPPGSIIMYATAAGQAALDGTGRNGLFTGQLLEALRAPGLSVREVFDRTGDAVLNASSGRQHPQISVSFFGTAYLGSQPSPNPPPSPGPVITPQARFERDIEIIRTSGPGNYTVTLTGDIMFTTGFNFTGMQGKIITLQGDNVMRSIINMQNDFGILFNIPVECFLILGNNITLNGNNSTKSDTEKWATGVVQIDGGRFEMRNGAVIKDGGHNGVAVDNGTFLMNGGIIRDNNRNGISINGRSGNYTMNGGTISGNNYAGVYNSDSTFIMNSGTINNNRSGGVHSYGTFYMTGGTINDNTNNYGGGVRVQHGVFGMSGGTISGNIAEHVGGGVYVAKGGVLIKTGGTISDSNRARFGNVWGRNNNHTLLGNYRNRASGPSDNITFRCQ